MNTVNLSRRGLLLGLSTLAVVAITGTGTAAERTAVAVLVSKKGKLNELSFGTLRRLFQAKVVNDPDGGRLVPINLPAANPVRQAFDRAVLKMDPDEVGRYWIDQSIRGRAKPPRTADSVGAMIRMLEKNAAAVGYAPMAAVTAHARLLRVDGKVPSDEGYAVVA